MSADRTSGVAKAFLPEKRKIEHALDQNHAGEVADRFPGEESAFRAGQQPRKGSADATAIEIDDAMVLTAGKDHTPAEGILASRTAQRRRVEGSVTRSGSLRGGAALSSDLCSRKYRRRAWLRATRL
jgi:hypothetical protein